MSTIDNGHFTTAETAPIMASVHTHLVANHRSRPHFITILNTAYRPLMSSALSIRQLTKTYGNGFQALSGIDLDVA
ncbi:MAG: hypothetical protein EOP02_05020, partial [Proteobacteria bacterium]